MKDILNILSKLIQCWYTKYSVNNVHWKDSRTSLETWSKYEFNIYFACLYNNIKIIFHKLHSYFQKTAEKDKIVGMTYNHYYSKLKI